MKRLGNEDSKNPCSTEIVVKLSINQMIVDKFQCNVSLLFYSQDKEQGVVLKKAMTLFYSAGIKQISDGDST